MVFEQKPQLNLREQAKGTSVGRAARGKRKYKGPKVRSLPKCVKNSKVASRTQVIKQGVVGDLIREMVCMWGPL